GADMLISLGGSSTADAAKGINLALAEAETPEAFFARFDRSEFTLPGSLRATEFSQPKLPFIAIPTTLSGGEFTAGAGITDTVRRHKDVSYDDGVTARVVILDPELTVHTGRELWASTAMKSLADCFEVVCSLRHQPFADALSLHAARLINHYLLPSIAEPMDMGARALLQHAAGMSLQGLGSVGGGVVAALRHQIGAIYDVPHGVASTIVLPHGLSFNRPEVDERLALVATALGLHSADAAIDRVRQLVAAAGLPARLRDVGVPREGIQVIARASSTDHQVRNNPKPVSEEQLISVLAQAW
ncbi:MAG: iron-containing alcohol dehydrogenase, partial [Chloroflexota bacterium]